MKRPFIKKPHLPPHRLRELAILCAGMALLILMGAAVSLGSTSKLLAIAPGTQTASWLSCYLRNNCSVPGFSCTITSPTSGSTVPQGNFELNWQENSGPGGIIGVQDSNGNFFSNTTTGGGGMTGEVIIDNTGSFPSSDTFSICLDDPTSGTLCGYCPVTYTMMSYGGGGGTSHPPPTLNYFYASPSAVAANGNTTLYWSANGSFTLPGTGCTVFGGGGTQSSNGPSGYEVTGSVPWNSTYELMCDDDYGHSLTAYAPVLVYPTVTLSVPSSANVGTTPTISWSNSNATFCSVSGPGLATTTAYSGGSYQYSYQQTSLLTAASTYTGTYTAVCSNAGGSATTTAQMQIVTPPAVTLSPATQTISYGAAANFTYTTDGTQWYVSSQVDGVSNGFPSNGALTLTNLAVGTHTVVLSAVNGAGTNTATATVTVAPVAVTLTPPTQTIASGATASLVYAVIGTATGVTYKVDNGASTTLSNLVGGTITLPGLADGTHTVYIAAQNSGGSGGASATITLDTPAVLINALPNPISSGGTSKITWSSSDIVANSCQVTNTGDSTMWTGDNNASGMSTPALAAQRTYTLTCSLPPVAGGTNKIYLTYVPLSWVNQTGSGSYNWQSLASSADGTKLAAAPSGGDIYTSSDGGVTWTAQTGSGSHYWDMITSSSDGTKLAATSGYADIYTSQDGGVTWTAQAGSANHWWQAIASSADGTKLAAYDLINNEIYTSQDGGVTWIGQSGSSGHSFQSIAMSADGTKLAAAPDGGYIYTSQNGGVTWTAQTGSGSHYWDMITSSSDGTKLAAVVAGGDIFTSTDGGNTWTDQTASGNRNWQTISSSADGNTLMAGVFYGDTYLSTNGGATWTDETPAWPNNFEASYAITSSSDGTKFAITSAGDIYTLAVGAPTWTVPNDWNDASNTVEVIGGGGGGSYISGMGGAGGGGGAYAKVTDVTLTPGAAIQYQVGAGGAGATLQGVAGAAGGATYFDGTGSSCASQLICAGGGGGGGTSSAGAGGVATGGIAGGAGGPTNATPNSGGGGGGAAGPGGAGQAGIASNGGAGDAGKGGAGGIGWNNAGALGKEWDSTHGSGGGGGVGANGGNYGAGGGGGSNDNGGAGAPGLIVITYSNPPSTPTITSKVVVSIASPLGALGIGQSAFKATPARVRKGKTTSLTWNTTNMTSCTVTDQTHATVKDVFGNALSGAAYVTSSGSTVTVNSDTIYTLTCTDGTTPQSQSITVSLIPTYQEQ